ncbi:MAG: homocysteine S-methyltransferase [Caldilineaceae bacterium]|nr:homocysteine S-methyltransferase [Caldilineaceae bacterium]
MFVMHSNPIDKILQRQPVMILDGGLATELEKRGADLNDPLWSARILVEAPEMIRQLHYDYFVAGADVAITASYQASFEGFMRRGLSRAEAADLIRLSVELAKTARDDFWRDPNHQRGRIRPLVAASVGCYGAFLADGSEYRGDYGLSKAELIEWHRPRLRVLVEAEPDLLACETIPCRVEGEALVELLAEFPHAPAWLSFSCCDEIHVCHGEPFADCVALANRSPQIVAIGINCTPPRYVAPLLRSAAGITTKPLLCYPNSGEEYDAATNGWRGGTGLTHFAAPARIWREAGAQLIGGCCRTGPEDVRAIAEAVRSPI